jgi:hypothetical protein
MLKRNLAPIIASLLAFCWMFFFFHDVFRYPNAHLLNDQGDGMKAFFVFADHIKNDQSYHQQRNMNYPYGQTFVYTDGQPAIANAFKFLSGFIPFFSTHCIALYNYLILFSFVGCAFFLALILRRFQVSVVISILGAFCITALTPQIWRISGHPTMAYPVFFPIAWYLWLRLLDSGFSIKLLLLTIINTTFWFFVHPYLGMVITFFYGAYFFLLMLTKQRKKFSGFRNIISGVIVIIIPLVLLKLYSFAVDYHQFRPEFPWGFWKYYTSPRWIFLPHSGPLERMLKYYGLGNVDWDMEKLYYIGIMTDIILLILIFRILRFVYFGKFNRILKPVQNDSLRFSFGASLLLLLFAMCIPFIWGLDSVANYLGFLRQFRSLGRFAWAFYYVATVLGMYGFYLLIRYLIMKGMRVMAFTLMFFFFSAFIVEAYFDVKDKARWAVVPENIFNEKLLPEQSRELIAEVNKYKESHQCIVTLPFFHVGSDNFGVEFTEESLKISCIVSYWCNMPMMASSAARSPIVEARNLMQFFSPGYIKKSIQHDLPLKKDFLILYDKENLNASEKLMLSNSKKLYDNGKYELWSLPYDKVFGDNTNEIAASYHAAKDSLITEDNFLVSKKNGILSYNTFDGMESEFTYKGNGAMQSKKGNFTVLYEGDKVLQPGVDYTVSFWYYNKGELRNLVLCAVEECNSDGSNCRWDIAWDPRRSMVIDGDWSLIEKTFQVKEANEKVKILLHWDEDVDLSIYIDEFLLREASTNVYAEKYSGKNAYLFYNNNWISSSRD